MPSLISIPEAVQIIAAFNLSPVFASALQNGVLPPKLSGEWRAPSILYEPGNETVTALLEHLPMCEHVLPLAEEGDVPALLGAGMNGGKISSYFISIYEGPDEPIVFDSYDRFMAHQFLQYWDYRWSIDELLSLASELRFSRAAELFARLAVEQNYSARRALAAAF